MFDLAERILKIIAGNERMDIMGICAQCVKITGPGLVNTGEQNVYQI